MKLDELQKLCDEAGPFTFFSVAGEMKAETDFYSAARKYMPLLIEVARAAKAYARYWLCCGCTRSTGAGMTAADTNQ